MISFENLLFWDLTEVERTRDARGIVLTRRDAVLDGFFNNLQGGGQSPYCNLIWNKCCYIKFKERYLKKVKKFR